MNLREKKRMRLLMERARGGERRLEAASRYNERIIGELDEEKKQRAALDETCAGYEKQIAAMRQEIVDLNAMLSLKEADKAHDDAERADLEKELKQRALEINRLQNEKTDQRKTVAELKAIIDQQARSLSYYQGYVLRALEDDRVREVGATEPASNVTPQPMTVNTRRGPETMPFDLGGGRFNYAGPHDSKPWFDL